MRTENLAKIAVAFSGVAWGLFWIPLRGLNGAGIDAFWAFVTFSLNCSSPRSMSTMAPLELPGNSLARPMPAATSGARTLPGSALASDQVKWAPVNRPITRQH